MKIAILTAKVPQGDGIYERYCSNFINSINPLLENNYHHSSAYFVAIHDASLGNHFRSDVKLTIDPSTQRDFIKAANYINDNSDILYIMYHPDSMMKCESAFMPGLVNLIKSPVVLNIVNLRINPSVDERLILKELAGFASRVVVANEQQKERLANIYFIEHPAVQIISAAIPDFESGGRKAFQSKLGYDNKKLIYANVQTSIHQKIDNLLDALAIMVKTNNQIHLKVNIFSREISRERAEILFHKKVFNDKAKDKGVDSYVTFDDTRLSEQDTYKIFSAVDLFLYYNEKAEECFMLEPLMALASGCFVGTTSKDILPLFESGKVVHELNFDFPSQLAKGLNKLLNLIEQNEGEKEWAQDIARQFFWSKIGYKHWELVDTILSSKTAIPKQEETVAFSSFNLDNYFDGVGIIERAPLGFVKLQSGYGVRSNALAIELLVDSARKNSFDNEKITRLLSLLQLMHLPDGNFTSSLSISKQKDGRYLSELELAWMIKLLGDLSSKKMPFPYSSIIDEMFRNIIHHGTKMSSVEAECFALCGMVDYFKNVGGSASWFDAINRKTNVLIDAFERYSNKNWHWFEPEMNSFNAIFPLAMLYAYEILGSSKILLIVELAIAQIEKLTLSNGYYWPKSDITTAGKGANEQAPEEVALMVELYDKASKFLDRDYGRNKKLVFQWFLGHNSMHLPMFDIHSLSCANMLLPSGVSSDRGAWGTLSFWKACSFMK